MTLQANHNHELESETDPIDYENTCIGCKYVLVMIKKAISAMTVEAIAHIQRYQKDDIDEFMGVCTYNNRTPDQNLRFLARDNPDQESINEFVIIAKLARIRLTAKYFKENI